MQLLNLPARVGNSKVIAVAGQEWIETQMSLKAIYVTGSVHELTTIIELLPYTYKFIQYSPLLSAWLPCKYKVVVICIAS